MAGLYHYKCKDCTFEIMSTPWGGDVYGMGHGYYLYLCQECKTLTEIEQGFTERAKKDIEEKYRFKTLISMAGSDNLEDMSNKCSHCGSIKLIRWKPEDESCPICNGKLLKSSEVIIHTD